MAASDDKDEPFEAQFSIDYDDVNRIELFLFKNSFLFLFIQEKAQKHAKKNDSSYNQIKIINSFVFLFSSQAYGL